MMNVVLDDEDRIKMKKIDLIQQATTRLRRRQLEEQLSGMMTSMEEIQAQSKHMYDQLASAMTTTQQLTRYDIGQQHQQMNLLENQINLLLSMQQKWFPFMSNNGVNSNYSNDNDDSFIVDDVKTTSVTMSRLSSLTMISSLFSRPISRATSISEFTDVDSNNGDDDRSAYTSPSSAVLDQQWNQLYRHQRRQRTKNHRKRYQDRQRLNGKEDQDNLLADLVIANPMKQQYDLKNTTKAASKLTLPLSANHKVSSSSFIPLPSPPMSPLSSCRSTSSTSLPCHPTSVPPSTDYYYSHELDDTRTDLSDYCGSVDRRHPSTINDHACTVFDDTMAFLEQMDAALAKTGDMNGYDDQFFQDMTFLLDHPELCNQPLADLAPLLEQHHQQLQEQQEQVEINNVPRSASTMGSYDSTHGPSPSSSPYLKHVCSSGWQWYRFLSVLSASYVISLLKGPDDLLID